MTAMITPNYLHAHKDIYHLANVSTPPRLKLLPSQYISNNPKRKHTTQETKIQSTKKLCESQIRSTPP